MFLPAQHCCPQPRDLFSSIALKIRHHLSIQRDYQVSNSTRNPSISTELPSLLEQCPTHISQYTIPDSYLSIYRYSTCQTTVFCIHYSKPSRVSPRIFSLFPQFPNEVPSNSTNYFSKPLGSHRKTDIDCQDRLHTFDDCEATTQITSSLPPL